VPRRECRLCGREPIWGIRYTVATGLAPGRATARTGVIWRMINNSCRNPLVRYFKIQRYYRTEDSDLLGCEAHPSKIGAT
jgi:hypothetical protein